MSPVSFEPLRRRERLAHYKCPRRVEFVDQLPRQDNGKIYKRLLRDRYRERAST